MLLITFYNYPKGLCRISVSGDDDGDDNEFNREWLTDETVPSLISSQHHWLRQKLADIASKTWNCTEQKQPFRGVLRKRCSENMQHIYRRTQMPRCEFNKFAK